MTSPHAKEGWLLKNHAGREFASSNVKRWFQAEGFQVIYYSDRNKRSAKGHFDLRNVLSLAPSHSNASGKGAIDVSIGEQGKTTQKVMTISFAASASGDREAWLKLLCSAVLAKHVHRELLPSRDEVLARSLDAEFATQAAFSRRHTIFGAVTTTTILTPRAATPAALEVAAPAVAQPEAEAVAPPKTLVSVPQIPASELDTPRDTAPGTPIEADPPEVMSGRDVAERETSLPSPAPLPPPADKGAPPAADDAGPEEETFEITVPEGVSPGHRVQATTPSGVRVKLVVPAGAKAGMLLTFQVPVGAKRKRERKLKALEASSGAAATIQAHLRGRQARRALSKVPAMPPPSARNVPSGVPPTRSQIEEAANSVALERAATTVQANFRGHAARNTQQESSRRQWLHYYLQADVGEFDEAEAMAVTHKERAMVAAARKAAGGAADPVELRRVQWLRHYLATRDFTRAATLVTTELEAALVLKQTTLATHVLCRCLPFGAATATEVEAERRAKFVDSVRRYSWHVAETLAITPEEV